jgi:hypothetical protein
MVVPALVYKVLLYGALATAVIGLIGFKVRGEIRRERAREAHVPGATVVGGRGQQLRRALAHWFPWLALLGGLGGALLVYKVSTDLVIVTDRDGVPHAERRVQIGGTPDYPLAPGTGAPKDSFTDDVWVVNRSSHTVRIESIQYGGTIGFGGDPTEIPPGTAATASHIDYIGPDDPPPSTITEDTAGLHLAFRDWLTWD